MATLRKPDAEVMGVDENAGFGSSVWTNAAFVVEALVLLVAIVACMAVFTSLFSKSAIASNESTKLSQAVQMAQSAAEEFSSDPVSVKAGKTVGAGVAAGASNSADGLALNVTVSDEGTDAGTYYTAHITVSSAGSEVYSLDACRYVSEVE